MDSLQRFEEAFARALMAQPDCEADPTGGFDPRRPLDGGPVADLQSQPGFAIYRNSARRACIDALLANYPAVLRVVGEPWLRAAAAEYLRGHWPATPLLVDYGDGFPAFLAQFEPARDLAYLPAVATLDRCFTQAHLAADAMPLQVRALAERLNAIGTSIDEANNSASRSASGALRLMPHPAARWRWFDAVPALTLWQRNRDISFGDAPIDWCSEGALLTRPHGAVRVRPLSQAGAALLDACACGLSLAAALERAAVHLADEADIGGLLPGLIEVGAFMAPVPSQS